MNKKEMKNKPLMFIETIQQINKDFNKKNQYYYDSRNKKNKAD